MITLKNTTSFAQKVLSKPEVSENINPIDNSGICVYYHAEQNRHCIVGHWLHYELNVENNALNKLEGLPAGEAILRLMKEGEIDEVADEAINMMSQLQYLADNVADEQYIESKFDCAWGNVIEQYFDLINDSDK